MSSPYSPRNRASLHLPPEWENATGHSSVLIVLGPNDALHPAEVRQERESDAYVQSLARGLSVICAFGPKRPALTLSEVAEIAGITRAGARRILLTLKTLGYVASEGRLFRLTPKTLCLGFSYLSSLDFVDLAQPILEALVQRVGESCSASVLDRDDIVYVLRIPTRRIMNINLGIGTRLPAYAASMGRVLLAALPPAELDAYLDRIAFARLTPSTVTDAAELRVALDGVRRQGWALDDQELEEGLRSIAVPLRARTGIVAALNLSTHTSRVSMAQLVEGLLPELQCAQAEIELALKLRS